MPRPIILPIGPSIAYVPLTREQFTVIDSGDVYLVLNQSWFAKWDNHTKSFYAAATEYGPGGKPVTVRMHRRLMGSLGRSIVDHKNGNTLDNRRSSNLRDATHSQNCQNRKPRRDSASGIKGVRQIGDAWYARIKKDGKYSDYGPFHKSELAQQAYADAAQEHFGEFARVA